MTDAPKTAKPAKADRPAKADVPVKPKDTSGTVESMLISTEKVEEAPAGYRWAKEREADARIVHGKFVNRECPGASTKFHYRKYAGEKVKTYLLHDGGEYDLPIGVIKHLVNDCSVEEGTSDVKYVDPNTGERQYGVKYKPRFSFVSSEFIQ
jgi:hypothetical protein